MGPTRFLRWSVAIAGSVLLSLPAIESQERWSTREEIEQFLLTAEIVDARPLDQGVTNPWRLTLSDGTGQHEPRSSQSTSAPRGSRASAASPS
jgi:hypothetical protein